MEYTSDSDSQNSEWRLSQATTISDVNTEDELLSCTSPVKHETYKAIAGFSDYLISDMGRIIHRWLLHEINLKSDKNGYLYCVLVDDYGKSQHEWVHRLVAKAFCLHTKKSPLQYTVDHINRIKTDNRSENLRYATSKEQANNRSNSKNRIECYEDLHLSE